MFLHSILLVKTGADAASGASFTSEGVSISANTRSPAAIPWCIWLKESVMAFAGRIT